MNKHTTRFAKPEEINRIIELCAAHAAFERTEYDAAGKAKQLAKDLFSASPKLYCLVAENKSGEIVGYATYMKQYATWDAGEYIYMDCLFVDESHRCQGIGEHLVNRIKAEGKKLNCSLIQWQTPAFNTRAIKFYKRIGAYGKSKERFFLEF